MPLKPTDMKTEQPAKPGASNPKKPDNQDNGKSGVESEPNQANYGFGHGARLNTDSEVTQEQEYKDGALPNTSKYTIDKTSKGVNGQTRR